MSETRGAENARYVVTTPQGFTEAFGAQEIDLLVRLGLIWHDYDGHVLRDGKGNGVGPLHHFYRGGASSAIDTSFHRTVPTTHDPFRLNA